MEQDRTFSKRYRISRNVKLQLAFCERKPTDSTVETAFKIQHAKKCGCNRFDKKLGKGTLKTGPQSCYNIIATFEDYSNSPKCIFDYRQFFLDCRKFLSCDIVHAITPIRAFPKTKIFITTDKFLPLQLGELSRLMLVLPTVSAMMQAAEPNCPGIAPGMKNMQDQEARRAQAKHESWRRMIYDRARAAY